MLLDISVIHLREPDERIGTRVVLFRDQANFATGIGYNSRFDIEYYSGGVDEVLHFFAVALSSAQVQTLFLSDVCP